MADDVPSTPPTDTSREAATDDAAALAAPTASSGDAAAEAEALEARAVAAAIMIPAQVVQAKGHGHAGTAMALAPLAHTLFQHVLRHDPADPEWTGRDRLVLSAGHASLLLYVQLALTGYGLGLDELALSRTLGSRTPGHPELHHTPGVEMSTGPLGQGVASAVGLALAARRDEALHGAGTGLFRSTTWVIAGDGCLQEGVSGEASSLAGTLGLEELVLIWDDNRITIDGGTDITFGEDVRARYRAYGWRVLEVDDAADLDALRSTLEQAREREAGAAGGAGADGSAGGGGRVGRPTLVAVRSVIGAPSALRGGTSAAHAGGFGDDEVAAVATSLGFAAGASLADLLPDDVRDWALGARDRGARLHAEWDEREAAWRREHPGSADRRDAVAAGVDEEAVAAALATVAVDDGAATRTTSGAVLSAVHDAARLWGGSADLSSSTNVAIAGEAVGADRPGGDFVHFGIREHAMTAILSGVALHGLWRPYGSTYLAFSDYARPSIRLAALMQLPALYVYTHDSVAVGEDGPTHQPVEQVASLRTVPGLDVVRPGDAREVVATWRRLLGSGSGDRPAGSERTVAPTALVLSRQALPDLEGGDATEQGTARGGYVLWQRGGGGDLALIATGSEVQVALRTARLLADEGVDVRVVSLPCLEWFEQEPQAYRDEVLPPSLRARVTVEAGSRQPWGRWAGLDGISVGIDEFGESGSGPELLRLRGVDDAAVLAAAREVLAR
jgi:transketolase